MKRVRQVSIVLREVADTVRVTERPKKLKPLEIAVSKYLDLKDVNGAELEGSRRYRDGKKRWTYPMLIMIRILEIATARFVLTSCHPSFISK